MADNVAVTAGTGTTIATDDVGGVQYQRVKVCYGTDGVGTDVNATTPLPVTLTVGATLNSTKAEDAAHTTGDVGSFCLGVVTTSGAGTSATNGDYAGLTLNAVGGLRVTHVPDTVGGLSAFNHQDVDADAGATEVKASAGQVYAIQAMNINATLQYLKLYDQAAPTLGTDLPLLNIPLPQNIPVNINFAVGVTFANRIGVISTSVRANTGAQTATPANQVSVNILYK